MNDPRREILNQVATGTISAEEGAARLEALESEPAPSATPSTAPAPAPASGIKQVKVFARLGNTEIIGDPNVASAVAEGPHKARQDGDTFVIEQSLLDDASTFEFTRPFGRIRVRGVDFGDKLIVRMNPALALSVKTQAGNMRISGLKSDLTAEVQAGNCDINGFCGPLNVRVTAGNVTASGRLDGTTSTIRCQMGEVRVVLDRSSNVRVKARSTMGEISLEDADGSGSSEMTLGTGTGALDCDCTMGTIRIGVR